MQINSLGLEYHAACHEKADATALAGFEATSMLGGMKSVEFYTWMLPPDPWRRKPSPSSYKMDRETAEKRYPGATPILSTLEVRELPEPGEDGPIPAGQPYGQ